LWDVEGTRRNVADIAGRDGHRKIMIANKPNVIVDTKFKPIRINPNI
jgi:hypothetical protein